MTATFLSYRVLLDGRTAGETLIRSIKSIEVRRSVKRDSKLRLVLTMAVDEQGRGWTTVDDRTFTLDTEIAVLVSTDGVVSKPLVKAWPIAIEPARSATPGESEVEVVAQDAHIRLRSKERTHAWRNASDSTVATTITKQGGLIPDVEDTRNQRDEAAITAMQHGSDSDFVGRLADRNGYEYWVEPTLPGLPDRLHFHPARYKQASQGVLNVNLGQATNVADFRVNRDHSLPLSASIRTVDPNTLEVVHALSSRPTETSLGTSRTHRSGEDTILPSEGMRDPGEAQRLVEARVNEGARNVTATGVCSALRYGKLLNVGEPVSVRGAGQEDSGTYYVTDVTYMLTPDDIRQWFTLYRNATGVRDRDRADFQASNNRM